MQNIISKFNIIYDINYHNPQKSCLKSRNNAKWKRICSPTHSPFIKSTDISSPYVSLSQSSRM